MSIKTRLSLLISLLVLLLSFTLGMLAINVSKRIVEQNTKEWMLNEAEIGTNLVAAHIRNYLALLQELANLEPVRTMDPALQKEALFRYIAELEVDDIAIIDMQGNAWHLKGGQSVNIVQRAYVQKALAGKPAISDVIPATGSAVNTGFPLLNYTVPIRVDGKVVGAVLARTNAFALSDIIKTIKTRGSGYAYMINGNGQTIAHAVRQEMVTVMESPIETAKTNPSFKSIADTVRIIISQKQGSSEYSFNGRDMLCSFAFVPDFDMILILTAEQQSLMGDVIQLRNLIIIIIVFFIGIGIAASIWIARSIARPLGFMRDALYLFGNGDLTQQVAVKRSDEVGEISVSLNQSTDNVRNLVHTIKEKAGILLNIGNELTDEMGQTAKALKRINDNVENIKKCVINQSASVNGTNSAMEQMRVNITKLLENVENQSDSVAQSSSDIEQMLRNIQNITQTLVQNAENVENLAKASDAGRSGLQEVVTDIQEIARESAGLLEINAVMENIAGQTNLLSMNAAIEAAHAGEAGKGFAVVADEIRKLAESSGEQSKTISSVLQKIKESIDKITYSTESVLNRFEAIDNGVKTVSQQEDNIRASIETQNAGSKRILEAVGRLNELTGQVKAGSAEMQDGSHLIMQESRNLEQATADITRGMEDMADGTKLINAAVNLVNKTTLQNKENIDVLVTEVGKFKLD
ncbi:MAG: methyl-accepting chemotaxis protein [Treponema sp.]|jgi:methyl-accepting chemotaxis protein|nr:methyl-accepting chemotaxis protein [Treponema sp.]